jgi:hypothetical protein
MLKGLAAVCCAAAIAGCGSAASKPSAAANPNLKVAECMRANGVPNFPDPGGGGITELTSPAGDRITIDGVTFSGPAFESAEKRCRLFGGPTGPPPITEQDRLRLLKFAKCMRAHGVADFADPQFPPGGAIIRPAGLKRDAPSIKRAALICDRQR